MVKVGHRVHAAAPDLSADLETMSALQAIGVAGHDVPLERTGISPLKDLRGLFALGRLMRETKPDMVLAYTIKPVIWGLIAAALSRVPRRYGLVTGLGYAFTGEALGKRGLVQTAARALYRLALRRATLVFFQNPDDEQEFRDWRLLPASVPSRVVNGSGVDVDHFAQGSLPEGPASFLLIARLLGDKGIREYVAASRELRSRHPEVECHLVGGLDPNPDGIDESEVRSWHEAGDVIWHGALADVRPTIAAAHVYVLPSYREGTPRTVLEAMAMGRAIITTDAPGCRETVVHGENGFLVPPRDANALVQAMERFLQDPDLAVRMGGKSREIAEAKYDVHKVNSVMLEAMGL